MSMKVDKRVRVTPEKMKRMRELRSSGMTYQRIAKSVGLSYLTVYKYLNKEKYEKPSVKIKENAFQKKDKENRSGFFGNLRARLGL